MNRKTRLLLLLIFSIGIGYLVISPAPVLAEDEPVEIGEPFSVLIPRTIESFEDDKPDFIGCTRVDGLPVNNSFEQRVVELLNIEREKVGAGPLKRNSELDFAARYQARDMVEDDYVSHFTMDWVGGTLTNVCSPSERIVQYYSGYSLIGENIAAGYGTPEQVVAAWMASTGHRENMLNPEYREVGIGYYEGTNSYKTYWAMDLGAKPGVYPVIINNEVAQTSSPNVNLYIYGKEIWGEVRLKNDQDTWSAWMPFQEKLDWQIPPINGAHVLLVELRKAGSITAGAASSDSITLAGYLPPDYDNFIFLPVIKR